MDNKDLDNNERPLITDISSDEQYDNQVLYEKEVDQLCEEADILVRNKKFEEGTDIFKKALDIVQKHPWGIKERQIKEFLQDAFHKKKIFDEEQQKIAQLREDKKQEQLREKQLEKEQEEYKKKKEGEKVKQQQMLQAKKKKEETLSNQAYDLIELGTNLEKENDLQGAIAKYKEAKNLFIELKWPTETARVESSLKTLKSKNIKLLELKEKEIQKLAELDELKKKEDELIKKKEEEAKEADLKKFKKKKEIKLLEQKRLEEEHKFIEEKNLERQQVNSKKAEKLRKLEEKKKKEETLSNQAYDLIEQGTNLEKKNDLSGAISKYEEAKDLFSKIKWATEATRVENSLKSLRIKKKKLQKLQDQKQLKNGTLVDEKPVSEEKKHKNLSIQKKAEKILLLEEKKRKEIEFSEKAYELIEKGTNYSKENDYDNAIKYYKEAMQNFQEINWPNEAAKVKKSMIGLQKKKKTYEKQLEKEVILRAKMELEKEKEITLVKQSKKKLKQKKNLELEKKKIKSTDLKGKKVKEQSALNYIDEANSLIEEFKFDEGIKKFHEAKNIFVEIGWKREAENIFATINKTKAQKSNFEKKLKKERLLKEKKEKEEQDLKKKLAYMQSKKLKEEKLKEEKLLKQKSKNEKEEEISKQAFTMIEEIEKEVSEYKNLAINKLLSIENPYLKAKEIYKEAQKLFLEIKWKTEADNLKSSILQYQKLHESDEKLRLAEQKNIQEKIEEEQKLKELTIEEKKRKERELLKKQKEQQKKDREIKEKESIQQEAYKNLDESSALIKQNKFDEAEKFISEARKLFEQINWQKGAEMTREAFLNCQKERKKYDQLKDEELKELEKKELERKELEELTKKEKKRKEKKLLKKQEDQRKKEEERKKIDSIQQDAFKKLEESSILIQQNKFDEAEKFIIEAKKLIEQINWQKGVEMIRDASQNCQQEREKYEKLQVSKIKSLEEAEKEKKKIDELIKQAKSKEEKLKMEKQAKSLEEKMKKKEEEQIHKEIIDLLEKGGKLISNKKFEDGISIYEQSLSLFKDISWEQKRSQVLEMIKDARTQYQIYQKQLDQEEERERLKKDEDKELAEKIEKHEEMEKLKHKEESEKQREIILKERRISTLKEQAFYELDRANVSIDRKKYQKALNHLEKALENFTELDWKKEMQGTSEKINQVKFDIKTTYQPQKRGQSKKETSISESAYAKIDEADKKSRLKQYDEALVLLLEAKELFSNIKWTKALKMVEKRILKTEKLYANKKNTLAKIEARKSKKTEEDAFKLLEEVETSRKNQKFEQALKQATQAQKIFINLNWNDEAEDMKKMISAIKSEIEMQSITLTKEEEEKKRLNKIIEERRNKRRLARKKK